MQERGFSQNGGDIFDILLDEGSCAMVALVKSIETFRGLATVGAEVLQTFTLCRQSRTLIATRTKATAAPRLALESISKMSQPLRPTPRLLAAWLHCELTSYEHMMWQGRIGV